MSKKSLKKKKPSKKPKKTRRARKPANLNVKKQPEQKQPTSTQIVAEPKIKAKTEAKPKVKPETKSKPSERKQSSTFGAYISLMRLDKPIGILLILWPTYWSLWLAARGMPSIKNLVIFTLGCIVMRSAGCVINDYADRKIDGRVGRTQNRPLAAGKILPVEALLLFVILVIVAFILVLFTNPLTIKLSFGAIALAVIYPFMKRYTHMPQVVLGAAFAWSIPMAFVAELRAENLSEVNVSIGLLYVAVVVWAVIYDTFYAMIDRDDDIKIGVKSTAILFGDATQVITGFLQGLFILTLVLAGRKFELGDLFYVSLIAVAGLFIYQQKLIQPCDNETVFKERCFKAFLNNNYVGLVVFVGVVAGLYF